MVIQWIERRVDRLNRVVEYLIALLLAAMGLIVGTLVALRYCFNASIGGANEMVTILFVFTSALGSAVAVSRWEHIGIDVFYDRLPPRGRWILGLIRVALVGMINLVIAYYSLAWLQRTGAFVMPSTGFPRWVVQVSIPVSCGLAFLFCMVRMGGQIARGVKGQDEAVGEQSRPREVTS